MFLFTLLCYPLKMPLQRWREYEGSKGGARFNYLYQGEAKQSIALEFK